MKYFFKSSLIWALRRRQTRTFIQCAADLTSRVDRFNAIWEDAYMNVPFYAEWKDKYNLPDAISNLSELNEWPILKKKELVLNADKLVRVNDKRICHEGVTGGATGEPLHFRTWSSESDVVSANKWIGWAQYGIFPDSRCFLLWGHRHFYGRGFKSKVRFAVRRLKDWMTNNYRVDATNLSREALEKDVKALLKFKPDAIIAYSASLLALCKTLPEYSEQCKELKIKAVICSAGPLTKSERDFIGNYFGCVVGMEYGSMEGGVFAYTSPTKEHRYATFKTTHVIHSGGRIVEEGERIIVTALYERYLPLIRYSIGDYMSDPIMGVDGDIIEFGEVAGRTSDMVNLGDDVQFHGYSFMVCAEANKKIVAYQLKINKKLKKVKFVAQVTEALLEEEKKQISRHAAVVAKISEEMIQVETTQELIKAPSGKIRLVIEES